MNLVLLNFVWSGVLIGESFKTVLSSKIPMDLPQKYRMKLHKNSDSLGYFINNHQLCVPK